MTTTKELLVSEETKEFIAYYKELSATLEEKVMAGDMSEEDALADLVRELNIRIEAIKAMKGN